MTTEQTVQLWTNYPGDIALAVVMVVIFACAGWVLVRNLIESEE